MKSLIFLFIILASMAQAQAGRSVIVSWTDPNTGLTGQTYSVYRAPGLCSGTPVFAKIATGLTQKTFTDPSVAPGLYCYTATVSANSIESPQASSVSATVGPLALTGINVVVQ